MRRTLSAFALSGKPCRSLLRIKTYLVRSSKYGTKKHTDVLVLIYEVCVLCFDLIACRIAVEICTAVVVLLETLRLVLCATVSYDVVAD